MSFTWTPQRIAMVVAIAVVVVGMLILGIGTGVSCARGCGRPSVGLQQLDAGPIEDEARARREALERDSQERLADAEQEAARKRREVEERYREAIEAMDAEERRELERVRALPAEDLRRWLHDFDTELHSSPSP